MTMATSAFSTFAAIGNREDITDTIYRILHIHLIFHMLLVQKSLYTRA